MYPVSEAYKTAMKLPVQRFRMTGTIGKVAFNDDNILAGSFNITNQCSDGSNVQIGQVYIGELNATFMNMTLARYSWKGQQIVPKFGMHLANGMFEDIPLGVFTVDSAKHTASGVVVKAYDNMSRFDKTCSISSINGTAFDLMFSACQACGLQLGTSQSEFEAMQNGEVELSLFTENDIETWRDFVSWVSMSVGGNVFAGRDGKIYVRAYTQEITDTIDAEHRFTGCEFSDFTTRYTGISCVNIGDKTTSYYGLDIDDALTYNMGSNPFLQYGLDETVEDVRRAVLTAIQAIDYVPFTASMVGNPAYDLMDVFKFTDGLADGGKLFCMTKFTFNYNHDYKMEGFGQDPSLATARSKVDKELSGIISNAADQEYIRYYDVTNAEEFQIAENVRTQIINIRYITVKQTHIDFHAEIKLSVDTTETIGEDSFTGDDGIITITYYLNGEEVKDYYPVDTLPDGTHLLHLLYTWDSTANQVGNFTVVMSISGGSLQIGRGCIRAYIAGQGLAGDGAWDGTISIQDEVPKMDLRAIYKPIDDEVAVKFVDRNDSGFADTMPNLVLYSILGKIGGVVGTVKYLHRFDPLHSEIMAYDAEQVEIKDSTWRLKEGITVAEITSPDVEAEQILRITTTCDSNNVNFLVSFDHGETWYEYANGWIEPDISKETYGMFGPAMKEITTAQWAEKLTGTIMMKAIIHGTGTLSDIQIYVKEVEE